jgi:NAD-dependent DNA ligase
MNQETLMRAHQYLYYVLFQPVLSDYDYDMFCRENKLDGKGGSDSESHYSQEEKDLARKLLKP